MSGGARSSLRHDSEMSKSHPITAKGMVSGDQEEKRAVSGQRLPVTAVVTAPGGAATLAAPPSIPPRPEQE